MAMLKLVDNQENESEPRFQDLEKKLKRLWRGKRHVYGVNLDPDRESIVLDLIFNMTGYLGADGLERYTGLEAENLRYMSADKLIQKIVSRKAHAVFVSKISQDQDPVIALRKFLREVKKADGVQHDLLVVCVGPRMTMQKAQELGFDLGYGPGTKPTQVVSDLIGCWKAKKKNRPEKTKEQKSDDSNSEN